MKETHTVVISTSALELYYTDCRYALFLLKDVLVNVTQSEKTCHASRFDFSPRTQSYMNRLSNSTIKISYIDLSSLV